MDINNHSSLVCGIFEILSPNSRETSRQDLNKSLSHSTIISNNSNTKQETSQNQSSISYFFPNSEETKKSDSNSGSYLISSKGSSSSLFQTSYPPKNIRSKRRINATNFKTLRLKKSSIGKIIDEFREQKSSTEASTITSRSISKLCSKESTNEKSLSKESTSQQTSETINSSKISDMKKYSISKSVKAFGIELSDNPINLAPSTSKIDLRESINEEKSNNNSSQTLQKTSATSETDDFSSQLNASKNADIGYEVAFTSTDTSTSMTRSSGSSIENSKISDIETTSNFNRDFHQNNEKVEFESKSS